MVEIIIIVLTFVSGFLAVFAANLLLLDVRAQQAHAFDALGKADDAAERRVAAEAVIDDIAATVSDDATQRAFRTGAASMLAAS